MSEGEELVFDIETNGLLDQLTRIHCLAIKDMKTGEVSSYTDDSDAYPGIDEGLDRLSKAATIIAHNGIKFDIPAIQKVKPGWTFRGTIKDTMVLARVIFPNLKDIDFRKRRQYGAAYKVPGNLMGSHSLKAWGLRLGTHKGDYTGGWDHWNQAMHFYMVQDTEVTGPLWTLLKGKGLSDVCSDIEHGVAAILARQERRGFYFDADAGEALRLRLQARSLELGQQLQQMFQPWYVNCGTKATPRSMTKYMTMIDGYAEYVPKKDIDKYPHVWPVQFTATAKVTKVERRVFNPASRDHFTDRLQKMFGWEPEEHGKDGKPTLDAELLQNLTLPGVEVVREYLMIDKRLGQLANGKQAWLKTFNPVTHRIHGSVNTNGAVTGRMTHASPNMAQVPSGKAPYGRDCRSLFTSCPGWILLGADASALELCALAGYMARYDNGAYIREVFYGSTDEAKAKGEDMHSNNARALDLDPLKEYDVAGQQQPGREVAKRWFYAFIYGAGDEMLGRIMGLPKGKAAKDAGKRTRALFLKNLPALKNLIEAIASTVRQHGKLRGLDRRPLYVRSSHAALNTLLQSCGAVIMKKALVILDDDLQALGYVPGLDYEFVANVHDEWQIEVAPHVDPNVIGNAAKASMGKAGQFFEFPCEITGAYKIGKTWADTH